MPQRRILFLDSSRLTAYRWQSGVLHNEGEFLADEAGFDSFRDYLRLHPCDVFYLLADVADEAFQLESIPYVRGRDREELIGRKLDQFFRDTPFAAAMPLGRESEGRRDEKMLFAALTRPQHFDSWLALLQACEIELAGIYSLPQIGSSLIRQIGPGSPHVLLITLSHGGLRHGYYENGCMVFSRLTPLASGDLGKLAATCASESARTFRYLAGQYPHIGKQPLPALILAHPAQHEIFRAHCHDSDQLHYSFVDLLAQAQQAGLKTVPTDSRSETLFLHLAVRSPPKQQFAPDSERHFFRLRRLRHALVGIGAAIFCGCLLLAAKQGYEAGELRSHTERLLAQTASDRQSHAVIRNALPPTPIGVDRLLALTGRFEQLETRSVSFEPMFLRISGALDQMPKVGISRIDWQNGEQRPTVVQNTAATAGVVADIYAQLPAGMASHEQQETIKRFSVALNQDNAVRVQTLKLPFGLAPDQAISSSQDDAASMMPAQFSLRIMQKLSASF